jgi:uncharacterized membrane protein YhaH (DUF805 family)
MKWFLIVMKKYAVFTGRARRKEFWMFTLFSIIFSIMFMILDYVCGTKSEGEFSVGLFESAFSLAILVPSIAVTVRRLHDIGKSGWWFLLVFAILIGWIILLVWNCTDGEPGENKYGTNPKEIAE